MTKYFTLATDTLSAEDTKKIREKIKPCGWWHWLPNYWLIIDTHDTFTAASITSAVHEINPMVRALVLEVETKTWSALTRPNDKGVDMADWLERQWDKVRPE